MSSRARFGRGMERYWDSAVETDVWVPGAGASMESRSSIVTDMVLMTFHTDFGILPIFVLKYVGRNVKHRK